MKGFFQVSGLTKVKIILSLTVLVSFGSFNLFGQDSINYSWESRGVIQIGENDNWSVDAFENVFISDEGIINKYNNQQELLFSQSIRSLGRMTQLLMVNTMKLVHFSEDQQTLCYFDNTLSPMDDCVELSEEDIINASIVCSSNQPNKIWVLDNSNSTLNLLSLDRLNQKQQIKNLRGILDIGNVSQMLESGNRLYLLDKTKGIYVFDMYGSLLEFIKQESIQHFEVVGATLFTLVDNSLIVRAVEKDGEFTINLPVDEVLELKEENKMFYLRTKKNVHKFSLVFN